MLDKRYSFALFIFGASVLSGCSTYLITSGVLDEPEQEKMFNATSREEIERYLGPCLESRKQHNGKTIDLYEYVDGQAGVIGHAGRPMSGQSERGARAAGTVFTLGLLEIFMIPTAMSERSEATRYLYVIYGQNDQILAICPNEYTREQDTECNTELPDNWRNTFKTGER